MYAVCDKLIVTTLGSNAQYCSCISYYNIALLFTGPVELTKTRIEEIIYDSIFNLF